MIRKILIGVDGSASAQHALEFALDLASKYAAELHIVAVARPPEFGDEVETEAVIEDGRRHAEKVLAAVRKRLARESIAAHFESAVGQPAERLVRYAEEHAVDHIVVGHRGHTFFERWLIGSVARQVVAYARCAVTVVR
ncbi:MAG TPA: universal stress protein [Caldimonas sp.]